MNLFDIVSKENERKEAIRAERKQKMDAKWITECDINIFDKNCQILRNMKRYEIQKDRDQCEEEIDRESWSIDTRPAL